MRAILLILMAFIASTVLADDNSAEQEASVYSALSMGTGWALTHRHIVTNYHVIKGMRNLRLVNSDQKEIPLEVVIVDKENDLAVLTIRDPSVQVKPLTLALTKPRLGTRVFTIGYPHPNLMGTSPKITSGIINANNGLADDPRTFQVSVPVQSGNSGGPLLNMRGEVVGVITSKLSAQKMFEWTGDIPQNVNYAIKISRLSSLISELETEEQVKAGGAKQNQDLETLADKLVDSVIIVAGDGDKQTSNPNKQFLEREPPIKDADNNKKTTILIYTYAEPGYYDIEDSIMGSYTVKEYSKNTINLLKNQIQKHLVGNFQFVSTGGKNIDRLFYRLENAKYSLSLCKKNNASNIVASHSEGEPGHTRHFRFITYRMFDCKTQREYKKKYTLERNVNDRFGFEIELYSTFQDFLLTTPHYINWASR